MSRKVQIYLALSQKNLKGTVLFILSFLFQKIELSPFLINL